MDTLGELLDIKKQILYLFHGDEMGQKRLQSYLMSTHTYANTGQTTLEIV